MNFNSSNLPTQPGYYWVREAYSNDRIFEVFEHQEQLCFSDEVNIWHVDEAFNKGLKFFGPIPHPENLLYPYEKK